MWKIAISYTLIYDELVELLKKKGVEISKKFQKDKDAMTTLEKIVAIRFNDEQRAIIDIYVMLYDHDYEALRRDLAMLCLMDFDYTPTRGERIRMLCILLGATKKYVGDDYSLLLNECSRVIEYRTEIEDLPFV